jgi:phage terminase small subunit
MAGLGANSEPLTTAQSRFLAELTKARTIVEAAKSAKVAERTSRRWLTLPHVKSAYTELGLELVEASLAGLRQASWVAVGALVRNLAASAPPATQVASAKIILDSVLASAELAAMAERMARLEERLSSQQQQGPRFHRNGVPIGGPRGS